MLRIPCPWCGIRDEDEFRFGGQSHVARPGPDTGDAAWAQYLFTRDNPEDVQFERWLHAFGCGQWFNIARHTVTHDILIAYPMGEARPKLPECPQ
jgi:sarcosine oxidase subunit delta